jgi:hypothetical protein
MGLGYGGILGNPLNLMETGTLVLGLMSGFW